MVILSGVKNLEDLAKRQILRFAQNDSLARRKTLRRTPDDPLN
jgi:hypothetical protein